MVSLDIHRILMLFLLCAPLLAHATEVRTRLDRPRIALDETVTLVLQTDTDPGAEPDLTPLEQDFEILTRARSSQFRMLNGRMSRQHEWRITLRPKRTGRLRIPALSLGRQRSQELTLEVTPASRAATAGDEQTGFILELEAEPERPLLGEQVLVSVRMFYRHSFDRGELSEPRITEGKGEMRLLIPEHRYRAVRHNQPWEVYERRYVLFPDSSGRLTISPARFQARIYSSNPLLSGKEIRLQSAPLILEVREPPPHQGDWLPASLVRLGETWEGLDQPRVGEPVTRRVTLEVRGQPADRLPEILRHTPPGVRRYDDRPILKDEANDAVLVGIRIEQVTYIPEQGGELRFPAVRIPWWNTRTGRQEIAELPERVIRVAGPPAAKPPATPPQPEPASASTTDSAPRGSAAPFADLPWPWISAALALGWLLTLLWSWRHCRRPAAPTPVPATGQRSPPQQRLRQACRQRNWTALRSALLDWGRMQWPAQPPRDLHELTERLGDDLADPLEEIERMVALGESRAWPCKALMKAVAREEKDRKGKPAPALPPLYPEARSGPSSG